MTDTIRGDSHGKPDPRGRHAVPLSSPPTAIPEPTPTGHPLSAEPLATDHWQADTQGPPVGGETSLPPTPTVAATPITGAVSADPLATDQRRPGTQRPSVGGEPSTPNGQSIADTHTDRAVGGDPSPPTATADSASIREAVSADSLTTDQSHPDTHSRSVGGEPSTPNDHGTADTQCHAVVGGDPLQPSVQTSTDTQNVGGGWLELRIWAEMFNDAQLQRIATTNRAERGGVDPAVYAAYLESVETAERVSRLHMIRCYRRVVGEPIRLWVKNIHGLGEPSMARLLGHLGHPRWATPHHWEGTGSNRILITDPPYERSVSQLWQYCGHGRPGRATRGMTADDLAGLGSPQLKMLVHLVAEGCMKARSSPFRLVYEQARLDYADKVHSVECVRCGPSGKPAAVGTPWSPGHQLAAALRKVGKGILRDLWQVSA
ncbi:hypothetical protein BH24ACT15_BH24ACT15_31790 [soil metagenome]